MKNYKINKIVLNSKLKINSNISNKLKKQIKKQIPKLAKKLFEKNENEKKEFKNLQNKVKKGVIYEEIIN